MNKPQHKSPLLISFASLFVATTGWSVAADNWRQSVDTAGEALKTGDFQQASVLFEQSLKTMGKSDDGKQSQWKAWKGLGESHLGQGLFKQAKSELSKALGMVTKETGADSLETASVRDQLAWAYQATGDNQKAADEAQAVLTIRQAKLPADSPELADSYEHVGYLAELSKMWLIALSNYSKSADIRKNAGPDNNQYADIVERLAYVTFMAGKQAQSNDLYRQALEMKERKDSVHQQFCPQPLDDRVVFRALQGAPNCQRGISDGNPIERIAANGVVVQGSLASQKDEFSNRTQAHVRITNQSEAPLQILGTPATVVTLKPQIKRLEPVEARALADTVEKKGERKAKIIRFFGENATSTITTTAIGGAPPFGYMPPMYGAPYGGMPPGAVWSNRRGWSNWNNNSMQIVNTSVPDYQKREEARQKAAAVEAKSSQIAEDLRRNALGSMTLAPGQSVEGVLEFEPSKFSEALLRVPVGNGLFEFHFD